MSGSSGGATCPPARSSRSSRSGSIDQIARRCESSRQPEQLSVLPTNVGACSYTTSWDLTLATTRGCRIKPSEKTWGALAEVHARADVRSDLAMDRPLVTDEMGDFGAHP